MANRRGGMAVGGAALISVLLVAAEGVVRLLGDQLESPVSSVACAIVEWATPLNLTPWACLAVLVAGLLVVAMLFDTFMLGRRR